MQLREAIRDAIAAERAAERFYGRLATDARDIETQAFFEGMRDQERDHALWVEKIAPDLPAPGEPGSALGNVKLVETMPIYGNVASLSLTEALEMAVDAENHAALFYDALADMVEGELRALFQKLQRHEERHSSALQRMLDALRG